MKRRKRDELEVYQDARYVVGRRSGGKCEAEGLHHRDCPGWANVTHHILPRAAGGLDEANNLLAVWNGLTTLGAGGCHRLIHENERVAGDDNPEGVAERLGLLVVPERFYEQEQET